MSDVILPESMQRGYDNFHFAPAIRHEGIVHCSGQIGSGDTPEEEFRSAWQLVGKILSEAGLEYSNIIEFTSYHVGLQAHMGAFMQVKDEFVKEPYPAWTAIGITELAVPGALVEIRVVAG
jgi:enamine deaminase RidA (YjgF/YER057c/UK114 family)